MKVGCSNCNPILSHVPEKSLPKLQRLRSTRVGRFRLDPSQFCPVSHVPEKIKFCGTKVKSLKTKDRANRIPVLSRLSAISLRSRNLGTGQIGRTGGRGSLSGFQRSKELFTAKTQRPQKRGLPRGAVLKPRNEAAQAREPAPLSIL